MYTYQNLWNFALFANIGLFVLVPNVYLHFFGVNTLCFQIFPKICKWNWENVAFFEDRGAPFSYFTSTSGFNICNLRVLKRRTERLQESRYTFDSILKIKIKMKFVRKCRSIVPATLPQSLYFDFATQV